MTICGTAIGALGLIAACFLQSVRLTDEQTLNIASAEDEERCDSAPARKNTSAQRIGWSSKRDPAAAARAGSVAT